MLTLTPERHEEELSKEKGGKKEISNKSLTILLLGQRSLERDEQSCVSRPAAREGDRAIT